MIAEIVINNPARELGKVFDYEIPEELIGTVTIGHKVTVPFGMGNMIIEGFVINIKEKSNISILKSIIEIKNCDDKLNEKEINLAKFISEKYFCNLGASLNLFCIDRVKAQKVKKTEFNLVNSFVPNHEQEQAILKINESIVKNEFKEFLLYGITGSGKTEVYLQIIKYLISLDKGAIVLVPEISLTPQTVKRFGERFGNTIAVIHSRLSKGQKYEEWSRIKKGEARVVIGARSALFSPINNLGLVIIDEEHDSSYKSGQTPFYHACEVAQELCRMNNAVLVRGTATPDICTYYKSTTGEIETITLKKRTNNKPLPEVDIVDMREELIEGNKMIFSRKLYSEVKSNLERREQTILFLNRRGYDTFVSCRNCGFVAKCLNCSIALTYHNEDNKLICHYCGAKYKNFDKCPICNSNCIKHFGIGTQKVEESVKKLFPQASVMRMDLDTTSKKNSHEEILREFKNNKIDILIGTQMIAKGHDFANVTLVGVIAADTSLNMNDFRAAERTFNLLTQVSGRAGRGDKKGRVIVQTYESENYSILAAKEHNYDRFYNQEVKIREQLNYPPFCDIIIMNISGRDEKTVIESSKLIREIFNEQFQSFTDVLVLPEVPAPISKINKKIRWRIMIKCKLTEEINDKINNLLISKKIVKIKEVDWTIELNPVTFN